MSEIKAAENFKCESCGSDMAFDPATQALKCDNCGTTQNIPEISAPIEEIDFKTFLKNNKGKINCDWGEKEKVIKCNNCGAETIVPSIDVSASCDFCGSNQILKHENTDVIRPESIIAFKINEQKAQEIFKEWASRIFFAPQNFKKLYKYGHMAGMYIPYWTFDADTNSSYTVQLGTYYYTTETYVEQVNGKNVTKTRQVRHTAWRLGHGTISMFFDDVKVSGSNRQDTTLLDRVSSYDFKQLIPYSPEYLSGFKAEKYSIGLEDSWARSQQIMAKNLEYEVRRQQKADEVGAVNLKTTHKDITFKHLLVPLWMATYAYKSKTYNCYINGQTGMINGKYPISALKIACIVLIACAVILVILYATGTFSPETAAYTSVY